MRHQVFDCFPEGWHPYQERFAQAMAAHGVTVRPGTCFTDKALRESSVDGIHFHWIENLWSGGHFWRRGRLIYGLHRYCRLARHLGKKIVWTVHNHGRHEGVLWGDRFGYGVVARSADLVIVHSRWSEEHIRQTYRPRGQIVHMPLGNFDGTYEPLRTPAEVREALGLAVGRPLCGLIGGVRPYRGHELAIEALRGSAGSVQLLIAGPTIDEGYGGWVEELAASCPSAVCRLGKLSDAEYAEYVRACDVILLPYEGITGSAALLAAWTLARPVLMSDLPFFQELRPAEAAAGLVVSAREPAAWLAAVGRLLSAPAEARAAAARREADRYAWDRVIRPVAEVFRSWGAVATQARERLRVADASLA
jgi:glycosyltransferase involved in cell wall biosynthesis